MKPFRLYICSAPQDTPFAVELNAQLRAAGQDAWMEEAQPGDSQPEADIPPALAQADLFLLILSPHTLVSPTARQQWLYARQHKLPVLLLIVQSVSPTRLLSALKPTSPADGEILAWIDVRARPLEAGWLVLEWLKDRSGGRHDVPPVPPGLLRFYRETIPGAARLAGWGQIALSLAGALAGFGGLWALLGALPWPSPALFLDQFVLTLLCLACLLGLLLAARLGWNGFETFRRRCDHPADLLFQAAVLFASLGLFWLLLGVAASLLGKTALLNDTLHPSMLWFAVVISAALSGLFSLAGGLARRSPELQAWLPQKASRPAAIPVPPGPARYPSPAAARPGNGQAWKPNGGPASGESAFLQRGAGARAGGQTLAPAFQPGRASTQTITRRLRQASASGPPPAPLPAGAGATGNASKMVGPGLGIIQALREKPTFQVSLLFAPQDAPFGHSLERFLAENGLHIQNDLGVSVQAHVNARINFGMSPTRENGALILVLSPWLEETGPLREYWQAAMAAGMPILPVLLEDTTIPQEFAHLRWIDARQNLVQARGQILDELRRVQERPAVVLPLVEMFPDAAVSPDGRAAASPVPIPRSAQWAQAGLFLSAALKLSVLAVLFPMSLWMSAPDTPGPWWSAGLLYAAAYLQLFSGLLFFSRRLSFSWMMVIQGDSLLTSLTLIPFLQDVSFWPVGFLAQAALCLPAWEAIVWGWLAFTPEIREWALGGLNVRLRGERLSRGGSADTVGRLGLLAPLLLALVFLIPLWKNEAAPPLRIQPGRLQPGETIQVRLLPGGPPLPWTFSAAQGDLVTIRMDGGFHSHLLQFTLAHGEHFLAQSKPTLGGALVSAFRLPEDGEYELYLVDPPAGGLFNLSLSLQPAPEPQPLSCDQQPRGWISGKGVSAWTIRAEEEDILHLRMEADRWTLDPWLGLYSPSGALVAWDDDGGRLYNARILAFHVHETGDYLLHAGGQPGTAGPYRLSLVCSK